MVHHPTVFPFLPYVLGARSKAGGERLSGSTSRALPVTSMRLFEDGKHGRDFSHPDFSRPCLPYHVHFQAPHTPLPPENSLSCRVTVVLSALAEGLDPSAAERVFGYRQAAITS